MTETEINNNTNTETQEKVILEEEEENPSSMKKRQDKIAADKNIKIEKVKTSLILYIGNLPENIDNYELFELIQSAGEFSVDSMNIKKTKEKSAYAYVKFKNRFEVEKVQKKLHLSTYKDKIIKADLFKKEEKRLINDLNSNIFFKGFPKNTDVQEVLKLFKTMGEVSSIKPKTSAKGEFFGSGYLSYKDPESASDAILKLNGIEIGGSKISVIKYSKYETRVVNKTFPVVIVFNLPPHVNSSNELKEIIGKFAEVTICGVLEEENQFNPSEKKLFGIAVLPSADEVEKCIMNSKDTELNSFGVEINQAEFNKANCDRLLKIKKESLKKRYEGSNLIVKGLPKTLTEKDLYNLFSTFGAVKSIKLQTEGVHKEIKDKDGNIVDRQFIYESKGFGFVLFHEITSAKKCLEELNDVPYEFNNTSLLLKLEYFNYDRNPNEAKKNNTHTKKVGNYKKGGEGGYNPNYKKGGRKFNNNHKHQKPPVLGNYSNNPMMNQQFPGMMNPPSSMMMNQQIPQQYNNPMMNMNMMMYMNQHQNVSKVEFIFRLFFFFSLN